MSVEVYRKQREGREGAILRRSSLLKLDWCRIADCYHQVTVSNPSSALAVLDSITLPASRPCLPKRVST